jgi:hypothetical protein
LCPVFEWLWRPFENRTKSPVFEWSDNLKSGLKVFLTSSLDRFVMNKIFL